MNDREELAALETVLIEHQRANSRSCLCGWGELGRSHPKHQAEQILARWRLVPIDAPVHVATCPLCRHPWGRHNRMGCQDCQVCITPRYEFEDA